MNFIIFNLENGSQKPCDLANLSQSLSLNCEIVRIIGDKHEAIGYVCHKTLVHFAVEWADYALQNYSKEILPEAQTCIDLTRKWLEDSSSVSKEELYAAAVAAAASSAAYAAATAATAAAADAAYYAAANAANAANAAGADKNKLDEQNRQGNFILKFFEVSEIL